MFGAHSMDVQTCPNRKCKKDIWHGLPVGTPEENALLASYLQLPYCPGSHLFNEDGEHVGQ